MREKYVALTLVISVAIAVSFRRHLRTSPTAVTDNPYLGQPLNLGSKHLCAFDFLK